MPPANQRFLQTRHAVGGVLFDEPIQHWTQRLVFLLCWLLSISVLKKSAHVDSPGSLSLLSPHQRDDVRVSRMTVYFLIVERIC
jgi:hypothetical protein